MFYEYLAAPDKGEGKHGIMRVGGLTQEICDAKVAGYAKTGWTLSTQEAFEAERGGPIEETPELEAAEEAQEVADGNTSAEAVEENFETANAGQDESEASESDATEEAETPAEEDTTADD